MISQSRTHLKEAGETYWQHFRFATTFGLIALAAGFAAIIEDRSRIDAVESEAVEARAFILLLISATGVVAPLWVIGAPMALKLSYTILAYALPAALMFSNPELISSEKPAA